MKLTFILCMLFSISRIDYSDTIAIQKSSDSEPVIEVNRNDYVVPLFEAPILNHLKLEKLTEKIAKETLQQPVNAGLDNNGKIIPEEIGKILYASEFKKRFLSEFYQKGASRIVIPTLPYYPKVDSEIIAHIRTKLIGQYVTYFNSRNEERSHNIALAAKAINNYVVFPGETFSFNQVVGKRTAKRGYLPAPIIVRGELSEGIGGGICQVSSTLFNAADKSGMKIIERYSHSKRVPYVPPGRDATVSWYGPDFTFENKFNQPILIRAKSNDGKMVVFIYSSDEINLSSGIPLQNSQKLRTLMPIDG